MYNSLHALLKILIFLLLLLSSILFSFLCLSQLALCNGSMSPCLYSYLDSKIYECFQWKQCVICRFGMGKTLWGAYSLCLVMFVNSHGDAVVVGLLLSSFFAYPIFFSLRPSSSCLSSDERYPLLCLFCLIWQVFGR